MNSNYILQTDVLDLLFEHRNKAYGAYVLRKFYPSRLLWSVGFTGLAVLVLSIFTFLPGSRSEILISTDHVLRHVPPVPQDEKIKPKQQKPEKSNKPAVKKISGMPLVVTEPVSDSIASQDPDISFAPFGETENVGGSVLMSAPGYETIVPSPEIPAPISETEIKPTARPEVMPEFPGGINTLRKFLERNLTNPRDLGDGERISVKMQFIVGVDGKLKGFELVEDGGTEFNNEVIRVLKKMPAWIPGKSNGQNVSVYYTIPVKFIAQD